MLDDRTPADRARDWRESLMWMILAGAGTLTELGFSLISRKHFALGTFVNEFVVISIILIALVPSAVKASHHLGLPGGPLITAKLNGEPQPYGWGEVLIAGVLWSVIALVVVMITVFVGVGFFPSLVPHIPAHQIQQGWIVKPSRSWLAAYVVTSALSAGVQEEILFRFVLMAVFSRALMTISSNADRPPSKGQLWLVNIVQAYFFGLSHLIADFQTVQRNCRTGGTCNSSTRSAREPARGILRMAVSAPRSGDFNGFAYLLRFAATDRSAVRD